MADVDRRGCSDEKQDADEPKESKAETTEIMVNYSISLLSFEIYMVLSSHLMF